MKADQERVKVLLTDTVTLLCRNGLHFQKQLRVQGVLGITVDDTDVFIVHINEAFNEQQQLQTQTTHDQTGEPYYMTSLVTSNLPQFAQNPIDGSLQMIGGQLGRTTNTTTNQKHKCSDGADDSRSKRQKSDAGGAGGAGTQNQYGVAAVQCLPGAGVVMQGGKIFSTCTPLPRDNSEFQGGAAGAIGTVGGKEDKRNKHHQPGVTVGGIAVAGGAAAGQLLQQQQWQFAAAAAKGPEKIGATAGGAGGIIDPTQCYMQYTTATSSCIEDSSAVGGVGTGKGSRKVNLYPTSLSIPTVSFVTGMSMASVDFNSASGNVVTTGGGQLVRDVSANQKLWEAQQQQQLQMGVFDSMTGCTPWTVSQLISTHGLLPTDEHQQTQQESIQTINQLGMLGYTTTAAAAVSSAGAAVSTQQQGADATEDGDPATTADANGDLQAGGRGSKESRRSWTSKHKPHTCQHPGCRKSYFFVHDLRRHLRQKHDGMDYNETLGKYEPASEGEGGAGPGDGVDGGRSSPGGGGGHDGGGETDDGSPDESDDNEEDDVMAMALTGGGGTSSGKEVAT